jgi:hypothetical protein
VSVVVYTLAVVPPEVTVDEDDAALEVDDVTAVVLVTVVLVLELLVTVLDLVLVALVTVVLVDPVAWRRGNVSKEGFPSPRRRECDIPMTWEDIDSSTS